MFDLRKVFALILSAALMVNLTGCFDSREIDDLAYVSILGLDKGKNNYLQLTVQIMIPTSIGGSGGTSGEGGATESTYVTTVETPTIYSGLNMINNLVSKQIELSHAGMLVFSKELAQEGIQKYINALSRSRQIRGNMYVVVSNDSAREFIENLKPVLEINPIKLIALKMNEYRYTGFSAPTTFINFYIQNKSTCMQSTATLVAVNRYNSVDEFKAENSTYKEKERDKPFEGDYIAGSTPQVGKTKTEDMGLAVFDGDRMVGVIDGQEVNYYLMLTDKFNKSSLTLPDPLTDESLVVLEISRSRAPIRTVTMKDDKPFIKVHLRLEADILSIQSGINYESLDYIEDLQNHTEKFLEKEITRLLGKTAKELKSDICGFGKEIKKKCLTWDEWQKVEWLKKYKDSSFEVNVDLKIRRPGLMVKTTPAYSSEGEVIR